MFVFLSKETLKKLLIAKRKSVYIKDHQGKNVDLALKKKQIATKPW